MYGFRRSRPADPDSGAQSSELWYGPAVAVPSSVLVSDAVFRELLEAVLGGRYAPGERLPGQRALARDLGVTLSSLREALKRLEQMGLVEVRHGDAMRVRGWREHGGLDVLAHLLFRAGTVDLAVLRDVLDARALMLREIAGLAAQRATEAQAAHLHALADEFAAAVGGPDERRATALIDLDFFTAVARAADNVVFDLILNAIRGIYVERLDLVPVTAEPAELAPAYARIAGAVWAGDADAARAAAFELATSQARRVLP